MKRSIIFAAAVFATVAAGAEEICPPSGSSRPPEVLRCGGRERVRRVFPEWHPSSDAPGPGLEEELRALLEQGKRDRAASPEFLATLERLLEGTSSKVAPGRLPLDADWRAASWPAGWDSPDRSAWEFGDGAARQTKAEANVHRPLTYAPGTAWRDYSVTVRFESDAWLTPPGRSSGAVYVRFRSLDAAYRVDLCGAGDLGIVSHEEGGRKRELARIPVPAETIRDGKPWTVRVRGDEIKVEHEGKTLLTVQDSTHPEGTVGVESIHVPMRFTGLVAR